MLIMLWSGRCVEICVWIGCHESDTFTLRVVGGVCRVYWVYERGGVREREKRETTEAYSLGIGFCM